MNIENWIEENSQQVEWHLEWFNFDLEDAITVTELHELLKTHAIVPREPSYKILDSMESIVRDECKDHGCAKQQYQLAIKAAEND